MMMTVIPPEQAIEFMKLEEYNRGIEEGETTGEQKALLVVAKNMIKNNFSADIIATTTGLSKEIIEKLQ